MKKIFEFTRASAFCIEPDKIEVTEKALSLYKSAKSEKELKHKLVCHHRLELTLNGEHALTPQELIRHDMYYNRPYFELIIMTSSEHTTLHNKSRDVSYFVHRELTDSLRKKLSDSTKSRHWYNNGIINKYVAECPIGFVKGRLYTGKYAHKHNYKPVHSTPKLIKNTKISARNTGKHWYTNGVINRFTYECPEGFSPGFLQNRK